MFNIEQFQEIDTVLKFQAKLSVYLTSDSKVKPSCGRFVSSFALRSASCLLSPAPVELTSTHPPKEGLCPLSVLTHSDNFYLLICCFSYSLSIVFHTFIHPFDNGQVDFSSSWFEETALLPLTYTQVPEVTSLGQTVSKKWQGRS